MDTWLPYLIAAFLGFAVGATEVVATFSENPRDAFRTGWGWVLIFFNMIMTAGVYAIFSYYANDINKLILATTVGLGLPTLIRTNFTVAKQFQGQDLNINAGWLYDRFLSWFKFEIDIDLVNIRGKIISDLINQQNVATLKETANTVLQERSLINKDDISKQQAYIDQLVSSKMSDRTKQVALATFIYKTGGRDYVKNLVYQKWPFGLFRKQPINN